MKALDTNVVLRLIVGDEPHQQAIAQELLLEPAAVTPTVMIETGWVLASHYGFNRADIVATFETLFDHPTIYFASIERLRWAIRQYAIRGDLADLIHIAVSGEVAGFATFDRGIAADAGPDSPVPIETLG